MQKKFIESGKEKVTAMKSHFETIGRIYVSDKGQGTTEYAILVGVLVVIAIVAVTAFRGKLQELWDSISTGINSL